MVGGVWALKMERDGGAKRVNMMRLRAAVVLFGVVDIEDHLLPRRKLAQQGKTAFQLKLRPGREAIAVPNVEAAIVKNLNRTIGR